MDSSVLFCIPRLCSLKRSLRMRPVCPMYCEGRVVSVFKHRFAINHVNQVIRGTREFSPFEILAFRTLKL